MKIRPQKIQSIKTSIAAMIVASLGFFSSTAEAVITLGNDTADLNPYEDTSFPNISVWYDTGSLGTITTDPFLGTQRDNTEPGGATIITSYNAEGSENLKGTGENGLVGSGGYKPLTLADAGTLVYPANGENHVAFYLDVNQTGGGTSGQSYDIYALEIYTSASATFSYTNGVATGTNEEVVYKFSSKDSGVLRLTPDSDNTQGTSNWDVALYVPYDKFTQKDGADTDQETSAGETYIHFVIQYEDRSGEDTWSVSTAGPLVPEPSSALLISLGGLIGLLRRRR